MQREPDQRQLINDNNESRCHLPELQLQAATSSKRQQAATCLLTAKILRLQTRSRTYHQIIFMHHLNVSNKLMLQQLLLLVAVAAAPEAFYCLARWTCLRFACADYFSHRKSPLLWGARARLGLIAAATQPTQQHSNNSSNINSSNTATTTTVQQQQQVLLACSRVAVKSKRCEVAKRPLALNFRQSVFTRH